MMMQSYSPKYSKLDSMQIAKNVKYENKLEWNISNENIEISHNVIVKNTTTQLHLII